MNLNISVLGPTTLSRGHKSALKKAVKKTLALVPKKRTSFLKPRTGKWELSICLVSASKIRSLNRRYRKKDRATDVLSFSQVDNTWPESPSKTLGEIVICLSVAKKQAVLYEQSLLRELERLTVHGTLHLLGYDHELGKKQEREMFRIQDKILQSISSTHLKT